MSEHIEKIVYINLNKRTDRKEQIESELNNFGLDYERYEAIETPEFGLLGCSKSHLNILKMAREKGYKNILILEDDFTFLVSKEEFEKQLTNFFKSNIDYNICMISYNLKNSEPTEFDYLVRALDVQTASGYIVNSNYYNKLIDLYEWSCPLLAETHAHWLYANDMVWKKYQIIDKWFCFKNRIGKQRPSYSDTCNCFQDYCDS